MNSIYIITQRVNGQFQFSLANQSSRLICSPVSIYTKPNQRYVTSQRPEFLFP